MQLPRPTLSRVTCLALALVGCQRENPAFNPDAGNGTEGDGDATTTQMTTTLSTTQSSAGDGDGDPGDGDPGDGDPTDGPDSDTRTPIEDLPPPLCEVETHEGLWPRLGSPSQFLGQVCPQSHGRHVRVLGSVGTDWLVGNCPNGCNFPCDLQTQWQLGADNFTVGLTTLFPVMANDPLVPTQGCYWVEAAQHIKATNDACYYASLSIYSHEGVESPLLFNANRKTYGLTPGAVVQYGPWGPTVSDRPVPSCLCEDLEIECCADSIVVAKQFDFPQTVYPPDGTSPIIIGPTPFIFYGAQAQSGTSCEVSPELSWALWIDA